MNIWALILCLFLSVQINASSKTIDGKELTGHKVIKKVSLFNTKINDLRIFFAETTGNVKASIEDVTKVVLAFDQRCNNKYVNKRRFTSKKLKCIHHNQNLVESFVIRDFKKVEKTPDNEIDRFLIYRNIYNRNSYQYYDLVTVREVNNKLGKKKRIISYGMLTKKELKKYIENPLEIKTAFNYAGGKYILTEMSKNVVSLKMEYTSKTDHWLLNSGIAVGTIYEKIAKGTNATLENIIKASEASR